ncbi:hypothetical protein N7492_004906 [Penicillium capsulatum]|uniref:CWH43-like N-terminal domain-containing protein n=1 Tax=Penicillium capsulatum TaxID=69766 RepID=A0A9W9LRL9_9EURO|nr:hypothetical protein N7492_004906 [Penicillium capsulatum]
MQSNAAAAMLITMLVVWARDGKPHYTSMNENQHIAYISNIGAEGIQPFFITGSIITVVFLDLALFSERWLRHAGQLVPNKGKLDKACAISSLVFAVAGALGLILLSIFDTKHHPNLHDAFLVLFIAAYIISAVLICAEYLRLGIFYRSQHRVLIVSFFIKLSFIIIELALAIAFAICAKSKDISKRDPSAVLEWIISFVFTGYVLSFVVDLLPSVRTRNHVPQGEKRIAMTSMSGPPASLEEPLTTDSTGPNFYRGQRVF